MLVEKCHTNNNLTRETKENTVESIVLNYTNVTQYISTEALTQLQPEIDQALAKIFEKSGAGKDFLGWVTLPSEISEDFLRDLQQTATMLQEQSDVIISIGIGGSYLGAKAVIHALQGPFGEQAPGSIPLLFAGQNISSWYMHDLLAFLAGKNFSVIVISKSGTTTEPGLAFRILKHLLEDTYGREGAQKRIVAITDKAKGALKQLATEEGIYDLCDS